MNDTITIGMDLGDKYHIAVVFDADGHELDIAKVINTKTQISNYFKRYQGSTYIENIHGNFSIYQHC